MKHLLIIGLAALLVVPLGCDDIGDEGVKKVGPVGGSTEVNGPGPADEDAPTEYTTTESGLRYRILRKGDGVKPRSIDTVTVHYRGTLEDGTVFDSSYAKGETAQFGLGGVIPGWTEGLQLVAAGGMIDLEIPPTLGYGKNGSGPIGPNATLHFIVELFDVQVATEGSSAPPPSRRSAEMDAMLEGFVLQDLAGKDKKDDDSAAPAEGEVDGEAATTDEEKSNADAAVE